MKVNMTPNPLDVVTIHASQGDTEARQWEFELHNNGELIDTSGITEQMLFKAYKGGTEQLLPENGSTPTTSPFKGDIKYPQGLLTGQEFTYRQSPTEEDGYAKLKSIKGNTLVWNQLVDTNTTSVTLTSGHKFITKVGGTYSLVNGTGQSISVTGGTDEVFDLSLMFGTGNEPTTVEEFTSLFPLSYYDYNQGSLLSFMGNGIKTVGKNQYNNAIGLRNLYLNQNTGLLGNGGTTYVADLLPNKQYTLSGTRGNRSLIGFSKKQASELGNGDTIENISSVSLPYTFNSSDYHSVVYYSNTEYVATLGTDVQLEFGSVATDYEPYTSSLLNLPISTYFPSGMKSAGNVYDELTESKAITRIGAVDLGSLTWDKGNTASGHWRFTAQLSSVKKASSSSSIPNLLCAKYSAVSPNATWIGTKGITSNNGTTNMLMLCDEDYSDVSSLVASLQGAYLYYELATESETSFTTASLVTENGEIALANENGVLVGRCNRDVSADAGFIEGKIKLSDEDGDVYSNKIQIHVERSPQ